MTIESELTDNRTDENVQLELLELLSKSVCSRLSHYDDTNDAEHMSLDGYNIVL